MSDDSRKEEILINVSPSETRAALLENGLPGPGLLGLVLDVSEANGSSERRDFPSK